MKDWEDYYAILGVSPDSSGEEIKEAYRYKVNILHPDRLMGTPESVRRRAEEDLKKVNQAYEVLGNFKNRQEYHSEWVKKRDKQEETFIPKPKPAVDPPYIRFGNVKPGEIKRDSFIIRNLGGQCSKIWFSNPDSWVRIVRWASLTNSDELPLKVEIEAEGKDWEKSYLEYITVKLDEEETQVRIELQTKAEPKIEPVVRARRSFPTWGKWIIGVACVAALIILIIEGIAIFGGVYDFIERTPAAISLSLVQEATATRTIGIENTRGGTLSWTKSDDVAWIMGLPVSGTSTGEWDYTAITISAVGLSAGTHTGTITFAATGAAPKTTPVTLTVIPLTMEKTPNTISLSLVQGTTDTRTIGIRNTGGGTLNWTKSDDVTWITGLPVSGTSTGEWDDTTITISAVGLSAGTHTGTITFAATGVPSQTTTVTLTVIPLTMEKTPNTISLSLVQGTTDTRTIGIRNTGGGTLNWTKSDDVAWITGLPVSGTSTGEWDDTTITISAVDLSVGTHRGVVTFAATGVAPQTTPVALTVIADPPAMKRAPVTISLSLVQGTTDTRTIGIRNTGGGTLNWTKSDDVAWITGLPANGTSTGEWDDTTITISAVGLSVGTHMGTITFAAIGVPSQTTAVTLTVIPLTMEKTPNIISLSLVQGTTDTRTIGIRNTGGGTLNWTKSDDVAWITGLPANGTSTGEWDDTTITISAVGLSVGTHTGTITFAATGVPSQTTAVTLTVTPPQAMEKTPATISLSLVQGTTDTRTIGVRNTGGGTLNWTKSNDVAWITGLPVSGTSTGEWDYTAITISAVGLSVGTHTGTITFAATGVLSQTTAVTLTVTPPQAMEKTPATISLSLVQGTTDTPHYRDKKHGLRNFELD